MNRQGCYAIGLDYGSNSVRCVVVDCRTGEELGVSVWDYPGGEAGVLTDPDNPHVARQAPADFVNGLTGTVPPALAAAAKHPGFTADRVIGIGVDTTGSTPIPVDEHLQPLACIPSPSPRPRLPAPAAIPISSYVTVPYRKHFRPRHPTRRPALPESSAALRSAPE